VQKVPTFGSIVGSTDAETQSSRSDARFLCDVAAVLATSVGRSLVVSRLAECAVENFCDVCAIHIVDDGNLALAALADKRLPPSAPFERPYAAVFSRLPFFESVTRDGQPFLFFEGDACLSNADERAAGILKSTGSRSLMVLPLVVEKGKCGTLSFLESSRPHAFSSAQLDVALAVERQLSVTLENVALRERDRRATEQARFLAESTDKLFSTGDPDALVRLLPALVVGEFADWAAVYSIDDAAMRGIVAATHDDETAEPIAQGADERPFTEAAERTFVRAARERRALLLNESEQQLLIAKPGVLQERKPCAWMMAPIFANEVVYGAIVCFSSKRRYAEHNLEQLTELCRRASMAIEYAESFARERRLAQTLQQATLPSNLASISGAKISIAYYPAALEERVGGDWYDAFALDDHRVLVTIGDVTGHGLQASVVMAKLRHTLNVVALYENDLSRVLDVTEAVVLQRFPAALATAFVGVIDTKAKTIVYANAGHPPPLLRLRDGSIKELILGGLPIGARYLRPLRDVHTESIGNVELCVFYTDGLTEATRDLRTGEGRLHAAVSRPAIRLLSSPAAYLHASCLEAPSPDDVAIMVLDFAKLDRWSFHSDDGAAARRTRDQIVGKLRESGSAIDLHSAELIFGELVANVVRHAPGRVDVALERDRERPVVHVVDRGGGYDAGELTLADTLAESGRGLWLMRRLGGDITVDVLPRFGTHTRVVLPVL
jgi:GAF domain-containing protein/anti-sigma regulatory factor (Ser/Thr protein kinase)